MAGIYFHIPFCKRICAYCDFYKSADLRHSAAVLDAMHREMDRRHDFFPPGERLHTRYFGGGTPSVLPPEAVGALLRHAEELWDCTAVGETTLEANPDDLTPDYLDALRRAGVDRLSIGIQSFDDACLRMMNRRHTARQASEAVRAAQNAGFENITADLIFGIPGFGGDSLRRTLDRALALEVQHLSAYHLTIEPDTAFGRLAARGRFAPVSEETSEEEFLLVHETLSRAGFEHYEISNYARPGFRARHNAAYWQGDPYLGIGPAAHSFDGDERSWNVPSVTEYMAGAAGGGERLTPRDRFNEYLLTRLRTAEGIDPGEIASRFGPDRRDRTLRLAAPALERGLLRRQAGRLAIPAERFLLSDAVIEALFEE